jgi:hypothetical protein
MNGQIEQHQTSFSFLIPGLKKAHTADSLKNNWTNWTKKPYHHRGYRKGNNQNKGSGKIKDLRFLYCQPIKAHRQPMGFYRRTR